MQIIEQFGIRGNVLNTVELFSIIISSSKLLILKTGNGSYKNIHVLEEYLYHNL